MDDDPTTTENEHHKTTCQTTYQCNKGYSIVSYVCEHTKTTTTGSNTPPDARCEDETSVHQPTERHWKCLPAPQQCNPSVNMHPICQKAYPICQQCTPSVKSAPRLQKVYPICQQCNSSVNCTAIRTRQLCIPSVPVNCASHPYPTTVHPIRTRQLCTQLLYSEPPPTTEGSQLMW
ncbi:hypothetical protein Bbelb_116240 [Branchiostoma belcheri]|nr:hypothetical protein Bbelb_116240 [Branchiostoma belcheri]